MNRLNVPLYQQVKDDIKFAIQRGQYKPKEKIPPEPELSAKYSVSRITVRRAIEELCSEGYLVKMQGKGTFVNKPHLHRKLRNQDRNGAESFSNICRESGFEAGARFLQQQIVPSQTDEQEFFQSSPELLLLYIERVRMADGQPIFIENTFLPYEQFKELTHVSLDDNSIFDAIEQVGGRRPVKVYQRTIEITRATAEQAQKLNVPLSEPLFYLNSYYHDEKDKAICIGRYYYVGSRYMFEL